MCLFSLLNSSLLLCSLYFRELFQLRLFRHPAIFLGQLNRYPLLLLFFTCLFGLCGNNSQLRLLRLCNCCLFLFGLYFRKLFRLRLFNRPATFFKLLNRYPLLPPLFRSQTRRFSLCGHNRRLRRFRLCGGDLFLLRLCLGKTRLLGLFSRLTLFFGLFQRSLTCCFDLCGSGSQLRLFRLCGSDLLLLRLCLGKTRLLGLFSRLTLFFGLFQRSLTCCFGLCGGGSQLRLFRLCGSGLPLLQRYLGQTRLLCLFSRHTRFFFLFE